VKKAACLSAVRRNLAWFQRSGVMRPADGFWGVAERLAVTTGNGALDMTFRHFPCYTRLSSDVAAIEHRRADCNFETAFLFDLAAEALGKPALKAMADNLIDFLLARSHLRKRDDKDPNAGLWGWAMPIRLDTCWTDDNAWVIILLLKLAARGRPELKPLGLQAGRTLHRHLTTFFTRHAENGRELPRQAFADIPMSGLMLNPHWIGLACMALAHAAAADPALDCRAILDAYYAQVLDGPPKRDARYAPLPGTGRAWTLSEYAYLGLTAAVVARQFPGSRAGEIAGHAGRELLRVQSGDGHFPAEHEEAPAAPHLADLVYTDNWAVLAFQHLHALTGDTAYRAAEEKSLRFLASIQDRDSSPLFNGCWRGMYDTQAGRWGGGDRFEGGASSIYSGWTNAPLSWAFLFAAGFGNLFPE
jgi:hypothetical protein